MRLLIEHQNNLHSETTFTNIVQQSLHNIIIKACIADLKVYHLL